MANKQTTTEAALDADTPPAVPYAADAVPEQPWSTTKLTQAKAAYPSVTDAVSTRIGELLAGAFSERQQTHTDLKTIAQQLLKASLPTPPKVEAPK